MASLKLDRLLFWILFQERGSSGERRRAGACLKWPSPSGSSFFLDKYSWTLSSFSNDQVKQPCITTSIAMKSIDQSEFEAGERALKWWIWGESDIQGGGGGGDRQQLLLSLWHGSAKPVKYFKEKYDPLTRLYYYLFLSCHAMSSLINTIWEIKGFHFTSLPKLPYFKQFPPITKMLFAKAENSSKLDFQQIRIPSDGNSKKIEV